MYVYVVEAMCVYVCISINMKEILHFVGSLILCT